MHLQIFTWIQSLLFLMAAPETHPAASSVAAEAIATPEFLTGKNNYYTDSNFIEIPANQAYRTKMYLLRDTYTAFSRMYQDAKKEGVDLKIMSASRTFEEQQWIWEDKWKKNKQVYPTEEGRATFIMQFSAMPGTSRHHWGTEIDLNSTSESYFETAYGKKVYAWLQLNACNYGFCQTYDLMGLARDKGYQEEKWHWSYFPLSNPFLVKYRETVTYSHIKGFSGAETAEPLEVIANYVLSVSTDCGL